MTSATGSASTTHVRTRMSEDIGASAKRVTHMLESPERSVDSAPEASRELPGKDSIRPGTRQGRVR